MLRQKNINVAITFTKYPSPMSLQFNASLKPTNSKYLQKKKNLLAIKATVLLKYYGSYMIFYLQCFIFTGCKLNYTRKRSILYAVAASNIRKDLP